MSLIDRTITHWTAGAGRAGIEDKAHYHSITEYDGRIVPGNESFQDNVVVSDGRYAAHTRNLNTRSAGMAMAGMAGAVEFPFNPGKHPISERQFEAHCQNVARVHIEQGLPVNYKTCLTHAEVEGTYGIKQAGKWDLTRLPHRPELAGATQVGNYLRERVAAYVAAISGIASDDMRPILSRGDRGAFVLDLQAILQGLNFHLGAMDGVFGAITEGAVLSFQADAHLRTDGIVGPQTWVALMRAVPAAPREVTEQDLRASRSRTIAAADRAEMGARVTAGSALGLGGLDVIGDLFGKLSGAAAPLAVAQDVLMERWPVLLIMGLGAIVWLRGPQMMASIRGYRVEDARTRGNLRR